MPWSDPSVFAVEQETWAMRALRDLSLSVCLLLVHDRFIARQRECSLRRHLDSMEPGTFIRDIVVHRLSVRPTHSETASSGLCD